MLMGIVGKPNCGKSTFFKASTLAEVEIANYPFATIKPNRGIGYAKVKCVDTYFNVQCNPREGFCLNHYRFIPVQLIDVAGLVPGAHLGKGMGNEFLNDLNQADMLIHVVDVSGSTNEKGEPCQPLSYDPVNDILFLEEELNRWFLSILAKNWEKCAKAAQLEKQSTVKSIAKQMSGLRVTEEMVKEALKEDHPTNLTQWKQEDMLRLCSALRRMSKPIIIAANKVDVPGAGENLERIKRKFPNETIIPTSAEAERVLKEAAKKHLIRYIPGDAIVTPRGHLNPEQEKAVAFIKASVLAVYSSTGIQQVIDAAVFTTLRYIPIYPGDSKLKDKDGNILPDCFLLKRGSTAEDFAFRIHSDIGKNFIRAVNIKTKQVVGKSYILQEDDVIEILTKR